MPGSLIPANPDLRGYLKLDDREVSAAIVPPGFIPGMPDEP
jgi:hypothetical protein